MNTVLGLGVYVPCIVYRKNNSSLCLSDIHTLTLYSTSRHVSVRLDWGSPVTLSCPDPPEAELINSNREQQCMIM